jgi:hypothetical protein
MMEGEEAMNRRAEALKRWRKKTYRENVSLSLKARYKPRMKHLPPAMRTFQHILADAAIEIIDITTPPRVRSKHDFAVFVADPHNGKHLIGERYFQYAHRAGLSLYQFASKPLPGASEGIQAVMVVGPAPSVRKDSSHVE